MCVDHSRANPKSCGGAISANCPNYKNSVDWTGRPYNFPRYAPSLLLPSLSLHMYESSWKTLAKGATASGHGIVHNVCAPSSSWHVFSWKLLLQESRLFAIQSHWSWRLMDGNTRVFFFLFFFKLSYFIQSVNCILSWLIFLYMKTHKRDKIMTMMMEQIPVII